MARRSPFLPTAAVLALGLGFLIVSVYVSRSALDAFRLPKEIAFRAEAIVLLLIGVFFATRRRGSWGDLVRGIPPMEWGLCAAIAVWTAITTATSQNRPLSEDSIVTVLAAIAIFLATRRLAPHLPLLAFDLSLIPVVINCAVSVLQDQRIWNPFKFGPDIPHHMMTTALIGNPNDVGTWLVGPGVATVVAAVVIRGWRRWIYVALLPVEMLGVLASATRTALIAFAAGVLIFILIRPWRQAVVAGAVLAIVMAVALRPGAELSDAMGTALMAAEERRYDVLLSDRVVPFLTAIEMMKAHPATGVGPGCFKFEFMDERMAIEGRYPRGWTKGAPQNFGETHNDHLQVAAETGLPGYALFLAGIVVLAIRPRRTPGDAPDRPERLLGRALRIPLATAFFVVCLAQFPLQLAAPRLMFLTLAALTMGWDPRYA